MCAARVFASPSIREGFGITFAEAMAADCTVIVADHPESAANRILGETGFLPEPNYGALTEALDQALAGERPLDRSSRAYNPVRLGVDTNGRS